MKSKKPKPKSAAEPAFTESQLLSAKQYANYRHILSAFLVQGKTYTKKEVDEIIANFLQREVN